MELFDIKKMENILSERAKYGFSGRNFSVTESEMKAIIAEIKEYRRLI
jgi:hypothetical protein